MTEIKREQNKSQGAAAPAKREYGPKRTKTLAVGPKPPKREGKAPRREAVASGETTRPTSPAKPVGRATRSGEATRPTSPAKPAGRATRSGETARPTSPAKAAGKSRNAAGARRPAARGVENAPYKRGQVVEVTITGLGSSAEGVGKVDGYTFFVPGALTGEVVEAKVALPKKSYAVASLERLIKASPDRIKPECPLYEQCGGCQLQHITYEGELKEKQQQVKDAISRIGHLPQVPVLPTLRADSPWSYRNKMQVPVAGDYKDLHIGCFAEATHRVINVENCLIQKQKNNEVAAVVRAWMQQYKIAPYDEDKGKGIVRHVMGRVGVHTGEIMVCLVTAVDNVPHIKDLAKMLKAAIPGVKSLVQNVNKRHTNVILGNKTQLIYGKETIKDKIGSLKFNISCQSFFQVNSEQAERLYDKALEFAQLTGKELVADVYCGTGTITLFLAQKAKFVYGIEIVPSAISDAKKNAVANRIENADFILGDAAIKLPELVEEGVRPDVIILDPPRAGCEERVLAAIAKVKPKRVVYVSCNPATLARDMHYLTQHGFKAEKVQPVDMFSRSHHIENVALLTRE